MATAKALPPPRECSQPGVRIDVRVDNHATVIEQTVTLERHYTDAD